MEVIIATILQVKYQAHNAKDRTGAVLELYNLIMIRIKKYKLNYIFQKEVLKIRKE